MMPLEQNKPGGEQLTRRAFISSTAMAGCGLVVAFTLPTWEAKAASAGTESFRPNAFVRVDHAGRITLTLPYVEMGQGAYTAQAQLVAEELEVGIDQLTLEHAPPDEARYGHPAFGDQITGGSAGLRGAWEPLRRAGATARVLLLRAAAERWNVDPTSCTVAGGEISHALTGRRLSYGDLADAAAKLTVPETVPLKPASDFRVIGRPVRRVDTPDKVNGRAKFGIDAAPPGVKFVAVSACPIFGGKLATLDDTAALAVRGVRQVVRLDDLVAVVADHTWAARKGLAALKVTWDGGDSARIDTRRLVADCDAGLNEVGTEASKKGDLSSAEAGASSHYEATFRLPMLPHLTMEPINCTAHVRTDGCEIWVGCQRLAMARRMAAEALGLPVERVVVHNHLLGGGFGRRLEADYVVQAVRIAKLVNAPVKIIWSREEDVRHDYFRYHNHSRVRVALDAQHQPLSFFHRMVGPAVMARWLPVAFQNGIDLDIVSVSTGAYDWPSSRVEFVRREPPRGLNVGNWRGVGASRNCFIVESVIDDLARGANLDPVVYRRALLGKSPRLLNVLDQVSRVSNWGEPMAPGRGRGVAVLEDFGSFMAQVAEVTVSPQGQVRVDRVVCVVDCGLAVNPDVVKAQMEGGIIYGVSAALYGRITVAGGRIQQGNFDDCPVIRMNDAPRIEVHLVRSSEAPGGVGEPGTAAVFPAITNAIFAARGVRLRDLPVDPSKLRSA